MKTSVGSSIPQGPILVEWLTGHMDGMAVRNSVKRLGELEHLFSDKDAWRSMEPSIVVYSVNWIEPVSPNTQGGLFWGSTTIESGCVGDEFFMTRGHFHSERNRGEYYGTVKGNGMLVLMDENRVTRTEVMSPGSLHYIPGHVAHRTVNTGDAPLVFWACWPSDAGHDYDTIEANGFGARVLLCNGAPEVVLDDGNRKTLLQLQQKGR